MSPVLLLASIVVVLLLAAAFLVAQVASHAGIPPAAAIVLVGIVAGAMLPTLHVALTPATLGLFLPALIFEGAWDIEIAALRRVAVAIAVLALPGVLFTAAIIASGTAITAGLALPGALALGACLSATDPVAVLSLFRKLDVPLDLLTIVEGESIANDGVAFVLWQLVITLQAGGTSPGWLAILGHVVYVMLAGIAAGIVVARLGAPFLRRFRVLWIEVAVTVAVAYGAYGAANAIGASGIFGSASAGIALAAFVLDRRDRDAVARFWDGTALVANSAVFLLVGLSLQFERIFHEPLLLLATIGTIVLSRAGLAYVLVPVDRKRAAEGWRHAIALAGIRGGLALALALGLPQDFPSRPQVIDAVFAVVFVTIVVQGWTLAPLLRRLRLQPR